MPTLNKKITGNGVIEVDRPEEQEKTHLTRTSDGRFKKGYSGNYNGAPKKSESITERFRSNEKAQGVINKLFQVANTLGDEKPHRDAIAAAKLIVERLVPSLKSSDLQVETIDKGYVVLPQPEDDEEE